MSDGRQLEILSDLLTTASRDFDANESWSSSLDDKAQKTAGLAGLFVAAAFGFLKPDEITELHARYGSVSAPMLISSIILFVVCIALCLRTMWLRVVPIGGVALSAQEIAARVVLSFKEEEITDELMLEYKENELALWKQLVGERHATNRGKASVLRWAQRVLAVGIAFTALNVILLISASAMPKPSTEDHRNENKQTQKDENGTPSGKTGSSTSKENRFNNHTPDPADRPR